MTKNGHLRILLMTYSLKWTTHFFYPNLLAKTMRSYPKIKDLNTRRHALKMPQFILSTKKYWICMNLWSGPPLQRVIIN